MTHSKMSAKSTPQLSSQKDKYNLNFIGILVIGLCNSLVSFLFSGNPGLVLVSIKLLIPVACQNICKPLKPVLVDVPNILNYYQLQVLFHVILCQKLFF